jgi:hypothetical protein
LLREISDDRSFHTECACYKKEFKSPSFADYIIRINDRLLPVEAKIDINIEQDIDYQVSKYCELTRVILDPHTGERANNDQLDQIHVLIIDERRIQLFDFISRQRETIAELQSIKTKKDIHALKNRIISILS